MKSAEYRVTLRYSVTFATSEHTARESYIGKVQLAVEQMGETGEIVSFVAVHMPLITASFVA